MADTGTYFKLLRGKWLIDGKLDRPMEKGAVLIEGSRIRQVGRAHEITYPKGATAEEFDFPEDTILPGLIDTHVHLNYTGDGTHTDDVMKLSDDILLMRSIVNARTHLKSGVTTIRECGAKHHTTFSLREGIRQGLAIGPRMLLSGRPVTITGGHMWQMGSEANGPDEVRATVRQLVKEGADWIKVPATGGSTSTSYNYRASYTVEELRAIVDEAHKFGKLVGTHCAATPGIVTSLEAEVDMIIHCKMQNEKGLWEFREDLVERIAKQGVPVNCTVYIERVKIWRLRELAKAKGLPLKAGAWGAESLDLSEDESGYEAQMVDQYRRLLAAGVRLIPGSDAGFGWLPFAQFPHELECLVLEGMTPMQAVQAATRDAAQAIGISDVTGTLEPGKAADILVVKGNPARDIKALFNRQAVFLEGSLVE